MKQLSGLDVSFLNLETATSFGHVSSLSIYGRPEGDPDYKPYEQLRAQVESKLGILEPFRRRLVKVPFDLDRPYWINDPDFDLDFHLRHIGIPGDASPEKVGELVGRLVGRAMDRTKPLWEAYVIEGFPNGDFGILTKVHHATIDGAAGAELLMLLLDPNSEPGDADWTPESEPGQAELLGRVALDAARYPAKGIRLQIRALNELGRITRNRGFSAMARSIQRGIPGPAGDAVRRMLRTPTREEADEVPLSMPLGGPKTPFNATITAHRRVAYRSAPLEDIKILKRAMGATVNDVVMAIVSGALRTYLENHDALPDEDLIAMVPVSIRTGEEEEKWSNQVSAIFANLPTTIDAPLERVAAIHSSMVEAKEQFDLLPADMISEISELAPPALAIRAARLAARTRLADRTNPPANLVVSNVPGPRTTLHLRGGAPLKHYYPVSTIVDGQGLNVTVQSYCDTLDFGLVACRELVPDVWDLADLMIAEIGVLADELGVELSGAPKPKPKRKAKAKPKKKTSTAK